jgi:hypothetical protein
MAQTVVVDAPIAFVGALDFEDFDVVRVHAKGLPGTIRGSRP